MSGAISCCDRQESIEPLRIWGCPLWAPGQQGACPTCPRCMPQSTTDVPNCRGLPPAVFERTGAKDSNPVGSQEAVQPTRRKPMADATGLLVVLTTTPWPGHKQPISKQCAAGLRSMLTKQEQTLNGLDTHLQQQHRA